MIGECYADSCISVIVPIYNVEKFINKCIDSIINQTYRNLEIILVDDGSPDRCGHICDAYAQKDKRIKVIHKENGGLSSARNVGLDIAKGEYVMFVDSDDYIDKYMVDKLLEALKEYDADMSLCGICNVDEEYKPIYGTNSKRLPIKNEVISGRKAIERLSVYNGWCYTTAWSKLYSINLFKTIRFPVGKIHEDEFISHLIYGKCNKVSCIQDALYYYVQRSNGIMGNVHSTNSIKELDSVEAYVKRALYLESIGMYNSAGYFYFDAIMRFAYDSHCLKNEELSKIDYSRLKEIHSILRANRRLGKYCRIKNRVQIMLICISPQLHYFIIKALKADEGIYHVSHEC
jgi:glycosyltransferase involved in cell wall biosynthesis